MKRYMQWLYLAIMLSAIIISFIQGKFEQGVMIGVIFSPFITYLLILKSTKQ